MSEVVVYGGGVAAWMATWELVLADVDVVLVSPTEPAKWPEIPDGGLSLGRDAAALAERTNACGGRRADPAAIEELAQAASPLVDRLARIGVPFERSGEDWKTRRLPGNERPDAVFVGTHTELAITAALERLLAGKHARQLRVEEPHELMSLILEDGTCRGIVTRDVVTGAIVAFPADAVVLAGGGPERVLGGRTGQLCPEAPLAIAAREGAALEDLHLCQQRPAALLTPRGLVIPSGAVRSEGARLWVPSDDDDARPAHEIPNKQRLRFLHEHDAEWAELLADREATAIAREHGPELFLDLSHFPLPHLQDRLGAELEALRLASGTDPSFSALPVATAPLGLLGGLAVDADHATTVIGLFAAGRLATRYHGHCELGGNRLLADAHGGVRAGRAAARKAAREPVRQQVVDSCVARVEDAHAARSEEGYGAAHRDLFARLSAAAIDVLGAKEYELEDTVAELDGLERELGAMPPQQRAGDLGASEIFKIENMLLVAKLCARSAVVAADGADETPNVGVMAQLDGDRVVIERRENQHG